jgi:hypothetical protein
MKESVTSGGMAAVGGYDLFLCVCMVLVDLNIGLDGLDVCKGRGFLQPLKSILSVQTIFRILGFNTTSVDLSVGTNASQRLLIKLMKILDPRYQISIDLDCPRSRLVRTLWGWHN